MNKHDVLEFKPASPPLGENIYEEKRFTLRRCEIPLRGGGQSLRGLIVHPGAVVILPIDEQGQIILIRNHRWQIGRPLIELPAGTRDPNESIEHCAHRELEEETGFKAQTLTPLSPFFIAPGISTEVHYPFIAKGLIEVGQSLEADEEIDVLHFSVDMVRQALLDGSIQDAKTIAVLSRYLLTHGGVGA